MICDLPCGELSLSLRMTGSHGWSPGCPPPSISSCGAGQRENKVGRNEIKKEKMAGASVLIFGYTNVRSTRVKKGETVRTAYNLVSKRSCGIPNFWYGKFG